MSQAKKIISNILETGLEATKDSAKQIAKTINPADMVDSALGVKKGNELTDYLRNLDEKNMTAAEIEKRKKELGEKDKEELEKARKLLPKVTNHMKPLSTPKQLRPYEATIQDEERKKAQQVEMQKKQQAQSGVPPAGITRGVLGKSRKRPKTADFEAKVNIKAG